VEERSSVIRLIKKAARFDDEQIVAALVEVGFTKLD